MAKRKKKRSSYHKSLLHDLLDPHEAANYVNAAIEERSGEMLLVALRNVAEAHKMSRVAKSVGVTREAIYRILSPSGNPRFSSFWGVFPPLGLRIRVEAVTETKKTKTVKRGDPVFANAFSSSNKTEIEVETKGQELVITANAGTTTSPIRRSFMPLRWLREPNDEMPEMELFMVQNAFRETTYGTEEG